MPNVVAPSMDRPVTLHSALNFKYTPVSNVTLTPICYAECGMVGEMILITYLARLRELNKKTQKETADEMNCSQSTISKIESKEIKKLKLGELQNYAKALGYEISIDFKTQKAQ